MGTKTTRHSSTKIDSRTNPSKTEKKPKLTSKQTMALLHFPTTVFEQAFEDALFPHQVLSFACDGPSDKKKRQQQQWPRIDVVEHDKEYVVTADTPGVPRDKLKVEVTKAGITLSFDHEEETKEEESAEQGRTIRRERRRRSFRRTIGLPADGIDRDNIGAKAENGVLILTVPKAPETLPKAIQVE